MKAWEPFSIDDQKQINNRGHDRSSRFNAPVQIVRGGG
jgi:hypothetical protein